MGSSGSVIKSKAMFLEVLAIFLMPLTRFGDPAREPSRPSVGFHTLAPRPRQQIGTRIIHPISKPAVRRALAGCPETIQRARGQPEERRRFSCSEEQLAMILRSMVAGILVHV